MISSAQVTQQRSGRAIVATDASIALLLGYVEVGDGCWMWRGSRTTSDDRAYGVVNVSGSNIPAHRFIYELLKGPIEPPKLTLDHLCRTRLCVRPSHVEPVTMRENTVRGETIIADQLAQTTCKNGHPFDEANTYRERGKSTRHCRACHRQRNRESARRKAAG